MGYGNVSQDDVLLDLAMLEGNQSVPSSNIDDWKRFIQRTLEEAWIAYPWEFSKLTATIAVSNGVATLASGAMADAIYDVRVPVSGTGDDHVYTPIPFDELDDYAPGTYHYAITGATPNPVINTVDTDSTLQVWYASLPPQINASVTTKFPDSMILALGAQRYVRKSENPQADIAQEQAFFQDRLDELWSRYNRNKPRKARKFLSRNSTGTVGGD